MTYMMQNAVETGTGREARIWNMPVAGKTGTSGEYKDRWFCGVTPYYVAAVWTGFDQPARIGVSGNPAAQLFRKVMQPIHEGLDWRNFTYPSIGGNTGIFGLDEDDEENEDYEGEGIIIDDDGNIIGGGSNSGGDNGSSGDIIIDGDYDPGYEGGGIIGGGDPSDDGSDENDYSGGNGIIIFG